MRLLGAWRAHSAPPRELEGVSLALVAPAQIAPWLRRNAAGFAVAHVHLTRDRTTATATRALRGMSLPYLTQTHRSLQPSGQPATVSRRVFDTVHTIPALRGAVRRLALDSGEQAHLSDLVGRDLSTHRLGYGVTASPVAVPVARPSRDSDLDVLFAGRLRPGRGLAAYLEAAMSVISQGRPARFGVLGPDGGELAGLLDLLATHPHLGDRLRYEGAIAHQRAVHRIARADLVVIPGDAAEPSMALLEAMAAGVATICSSAHPDAAYLHSQQATRVVGPTSAAVAEAIRQLSDDPAERRALGRRGRLAVGARFDIAAVVDELEVHYQACLTQQPPMAKRPSVRARDVVAQPPRSNGMLWLTDEISPRRVALWREVGRFGGLTVALTAAPTDGLTAAPCPDEPFTVLALGQGGTTNLRTLLAHRPDALVIDGPPTPVFLAAARLARRREVPVVVAFRAAPTPTTAAAAQRRLLQRADAVLVPGPAAMQVLLGMGIPADRVTVMTGDELADSTAAGSTAAGSTAAGSTDAAAPVIDLRVGHRFGYLGPLTSGSNLDALLHGFVRCRAPHDQLTLAGSGPLVESLQALVARLGLEPSVTIEVDPDDFTREQLFDRLHTLVNPTANDCSPEVVAAVRAGVHLVATHRDSVPAELRARPGVFLTAPNAQGLGEAMAASRARSPLRLLPSQARGRSRFGEGAGV